MTILGMGFDAIAVNLENKIIGQDNFNLLGVKQKPHIYILALGGTISSFSKQQMGEFYERSSIDIEKIILSLPFDFEKLTLSCEQLFHKISHELTHEDLLFLGNKVDDLVKNDDIDGIVITHGTNCIEETAYFLNLVIKTKKPIVFTGSFRPINALGYDGSRNLYNAILLASNRTMEEKGVVLTFNDCIVSSRYATKINPSTLGDFSINGTGVIGYIQSQKLHIQSIIHSRHTYLSEFSITEIKNIPKIYIIYGYLGMDSVFVKAAIENNASGIISAGLGKGYQSKEVMESLNDASEKGIIVVRCSRTGQGIINREEKIDDGYGIIAGGSLNPQKASVLLGVALSKTQNKMEIQRIFEQY